MSRPGWKEVSKVLTRLEFSGRMGKSHLIFTRGQGREFKRITVPLHDELKSGTLRAIIRQAGLTAEEFDRLLNR